MNLQRLESRLRALIEVDLISVLPGQKPEDLIVQKLITTMHSNLVAREDGSLVAPNVYTLLIHPNSMRRWKEHQLIETLIEVLKTAGLDSGFHFDLPPTITISEDPNIKPGDINIIASQRIEPMEETKDMKTDSENLDKNSDYSTIPDNAFLIIEGVKVFPLKQAVINIGRRLDNMVVIDDPRVSRNHAQLRAINGRFVVFDLNSTGGTFVNGQRATQTVLYPGDVISLAGVTLIFGQDNPPPRPDLADTSPIGDASANRTTAVIHTRPPIPKKKK